MSERHALFQGELVLISGAMVMIQAIHPQRRAIAEVNGVAAKRLT
jgi:hypothetical protein